MKRDIASWLPYFEADSVVRVFVQRRSENAQIYPGCLGMFGGGIEKGETPEDALVREIQEELCYDLTSWELVAQWQRNSGGTHTVFATHVSPTFNKSIVVYEGDYGEFYATDDLLKRADIGSGLRKAVPILLKKLGK